MRGKKAKLLRKVAGKYKLKYRRLKMECTRDPEFYRTVIKTTRGIL